MLDPVFGYQGVFGVALLLAIASTHKFADRAGFAEALAAYRVLPEGWARRAAPVVMGLELALAVGILNSSTRRACVLGAMLLLTSYALGVAVNLARGRRDLDCGCGPLRDRRPIAPWMLGRNALLVLILAVSSVPWTPRALTPTDFLTIIGGIVAAAILYTTLDRLLGDIRPKAILLRRVS